MMWQAEAVEEKKTTVLMTARLFNSSFVVFNSPPHMLPGWCGQGGLTLLYSHEINRDNDSKSS